MNNWKSRLTVRNVSITLVIVGVLAWLSVLAITVIDTPVALAPTPTDWILIITATSQPASPTPIVTSTTLPTATQQATPMVANTVTIAPTPTIPATVSVALLIPTVTGTLPVTDVPTTAATDTASTPVPTLPDTAAATNAATVDPASKTSNLVTATPINPNCPPPDGWVLYHVQEGDTLFGFQLGSGGKADVAAIMKANCIDSKMLALGQPIYLPPGTAGNSPKTDDSALPASSGKNTRGANCPCTIRVVEGWRLEQIAAAIDRSSAGFSGKDFLSVTGANAPNVTQYSFLSTRPAGKTLEGFMFPGSYSIENATTAVQFRDMVLKAFADNVGADLQAAASSHGLTFWQAVVFASVVQKEAHEPDSQKMVASIFYNRMSKGMAMGSFAPLMYAVGRAGDWWPTLTKANIRSDTPYNMTKYAGLPPSAISSPSLSALQAVANPAQTDYLYMAAKCDGSGNFYARTFEEFQQGLNCP